MVSFDIILQMAEILVSACLTGEKCRYDGNAQTKRVVQEWVKEGKAIPFCPEVAAGLPIPRPAAEIQGGRVITIDGQDQTEDFIVGANLGLELCRIQGIQKAFLALHSPSCGLGLIYDGNFTGKLIPGEGIFATLLRKNGIEVLNPVDHQIIQVISNALKPLSKSLPGGAWGRIWGVAAQGSSFGSHHLIRNEGAVIDVSQHRETGEIEIWEFRLRPDYDQLGKQVQDILQDAGLLKFIHRWHGRHDV